MEGAAVPWRAAYRPSFFAQTTPAIIPPAGHGGGVPPEPSSVAPSSAILWLAKGGRDVPTKIQRWGNSQGVRVPKSVLADARLEVGDLVDVRAADGTLVVSRARGNRGRVALEALVAGLPAATKQRELDWGAPEGDEV